MVLGYSPSPRTPSCAPAAAVRITPDKPTPLAGYYNTRLATNTHDELHAKAIVLEQAGVKAALVVCDLLSLPRTVIEQTRENIARTTGVPAANVMISATHTTSGRCSLTVRRAVSSVPPASRWRFSEPTSETLAARSLGIQRRCAGWRDALQMVNHESVQELPEFARLRFAQFQSPDQTPFAVRQRLREMTGAGA